MSRARALSLSIALLLTACVQAQSPAPSVNAQRPAAAGVVEAVAFESRLLGAALPYNVVLPAGYHAAEARSTRYPVLFLLHGLGGGAGDWVSQRARLAEYAAQHALIIVVPEGRDGWYTDGATGASGKFESYFVEELLPDVQRRFRTVEAREGRAVAGLSMGGYGALKFGLKHPEKFAFAASMSGALDAASWLPEQGLPEFVKPSIARVFGAADSPTRRANDLFRLVRELTPERAARLPYLYVDCGTEDFLIGSNRDFSSLLIERKIPHEYHQVPGTHNWQYWDRQVRDILRLASQKLSPPARSAQAGAR